MISCAEAVRRLWAYLDDDLQDIDAAQVDAHLAWCRRCCGELEFARHVQRLLASAAAPDIPLEIEARLEAFLDDLEEGEAWTMHEPT